MKRNATPCNTRKQAKPNVFNPVDDRAGRRMRGLWIRNGTFYSQFRIKGHVEQVPLHGAATVAEAETARQVLKAKIKSGTYAPEADIPKPAELKPDPPAPARDHSIPAAIVGYKGNRDALKREDKKTRARENSGLNFWGRFLKKSRPHISALDGKMLNDFAVWRLKHDPKKPDAPIVVDEKKADNVGGRAVDVNISAIQKVAAWAVLEGWLPTMPNLTWKKLAKAPKDVRLMSSKDLDALANANIVTPEILAATPYGHRHFIEATTQPAVSFRDYIYLIWLSGGREYECTRQRWSNVTWSRTAVEDEGEWLKGERIPGHLFFPGKEAKAGGGRAAEDRSVDFHARLEEHLLDMYERRNKASDWMFPAPYDPKVPQGSFRKQLERARATINQADIGFHFGRHYFISHSVMAGVDFRTIAVWVSHRDGGILIGTKYSHLAPGHSKRSSIRMDKEFKKS
jgi:integrase